MLIHGREYAPVRMGQWPSLLTLPATRHRPHFKDDHAFLPSEEFIQTLEAEWKDLAAAHEFFALRGHVTSIHEASFGYEVECVCGEFIRKIKASRVDVCAGAGPSRRLDGTTIADAELREEYRDGIGRRFDWPRLLTGEMFLRKSTASAPEGSSVAIYGGGPTAAWCVERAQGLGCNVLWAANDSLNPAFLSSCRNDGLAQEPLVRNRVGGTYAVESDIYPAHTGTRFAEGVEIESIVPNETGLSRVLFRQNSRAAKHRHVNWNGEQLTFPPQLEEFNQVVVALGQHRALEDEGSWAHILEGLLAPARSVRAHLIRDRTLRIIGLQSVSGRLRILGTSALAHPDVAAEWRSPGSPSNLFFQSLVEQARVDLGITLAAVTIAEANELWGDSKSNNNRNTACRRDLQSIWLSLAHAVGGWSDMRAVRIHPITTEELQMVLNSTTDHY